MNQDAIHMYRKIASVGSASKNPGSGDFSAANVSSRSVGSDIDPVITITPTTVREHIAKERL